MFKLERSGLSQKLTLMSVLSTGSALLLVFAVFAVTSVRSHREEAAQQLATLAAVTGASSQAARAYGNPAQARRMLAALALETDVLQAALYDSTGRLVARYVAPRLPAAPEAPDAPTAPDTLE
ncbi:CHASE sensor domain-containing protein, partial [Duganella callida]